MRWKSRSLIAVTCIWTTSCLPSEACQPFAVSWIPVIISILFLLGSRGEIVQVKRGYARNMLIPRKLAGILGLHWWYDLHEKTESGITINVIQFTYLPKLLSFPAYATPENKTKHEVIIEHRAKLIADGIIDATNVALSNASLIPQLANVSFWSSDNVHVTNHYSIDINYGHFFYKYVCGLSKFVWFWRQILHMMV